MIKCFLKKNRNFLNVVITKKNYKEKKEERRRRRRRNNYKRLDPCLIRTKRQRGTYKVVSSKNKNQQKTPKLDLNTAYERRNPAWQDQKRWLCKFYNPINLI